MANLEYLHEFFTRMHDKIGESSTTYRCLKSNAWCDERFHGAFTMIQGDDDHHTIRMDPSLDGINFCLVMFDLRNGFRSTWNETVKFWRGLGSKMTIALEVRLPVTIVHEKPVILHPLPRTTRTLIRLKLSGFPFTV